MTPDFDTPQFQRDWLERPATLRELVTWAYHIHRSDVGIYANLLRHLPAKEAAKKLWHAYRNALPIPRLLTLADEFNREMLTLKLLSQQPKPSKPTVGKAKDRLGEKQRRAEKEAADRAAKRALASKPTPTQVGTLWEGMNP